MLLRGTRSRLSHVHPEHLADRSFSQTEIVSPEEAIGALPGRRANVAFGKTLGHSAILRRFYQRHFAPPAAQLRLEAARFVPFRFVRESIGYFDFSASSS